MIWSMATWIVIGWGLVAAVYMVGTALLRFPGRTIDDVVAFLRPVDVEQAEALLDPTTDVELRWNLDPATFCEVQRKRMHMYLELVRRMAHNSRVLVELGNRGEYSRDEREADLIGALQREAVTVRLYSLLTIIRMRVLLAIRPMSAPSLAKLRSIKNVDGLSSYKALRAASTAIFEEYCRPVDKLVQSF